MSPRSIRAGAIAGLVMAALYVVVVRGVSGSWQHLTDQVRADWYLLALILAGFTAQVAMLAELRRRRHMQAAFLATGGAGTGAAAAGMVACCAHHIADLAPLAGATGAATFLYDYRIPFIIVGVGINAIGVLLAARALARTPRIGSKEMEQCALV